MLGQQSVVVGFFRLIVAIDRFQTDFGIWNCVDPRVQFRNLFISFTEHLLLPLGVAIDHRDLCFQCEKARIAQLHQLLFSLLDAILPIGDHLILIAFHRIKLRLFRDHIRMFFFVLRQQVLQLGLEFRSPSG